MSDQTMVFATHTVFLGSLTHEVNVLQNRREDCTNSRGEGKWQLPLSSPCAESLVVISPLLRTTCTLREAVLE